jgi:guanylate kinase
VNHSNPSSSQKNVSPIPELPTDPIVSLGAKHSGLLFVLSGPSGVGKDAVINELKKRQLPLHFTVTCTTRALRPGEVEGVSYYFVEEARFQEMKRRGELLEWACVHGNNYGTPIQLVRTALDRGTNVLLKIDVQGAAQVKAKAPGAVFIFLAPPSMPELVARLTRRRTESLKELEVRIANAYEEMAHLQDYDYVVVNYAEQLEEAVARIQAIIVAEGCRVSSRCISL